MIEPKVSIESFYMPSRNAFKSVKKRLRFGNDIFSLRYVHTSFDWENKAPVDETHELRFGLNFPTFLNEKWFVLTMIHTKATFQEHLSNAISVGAMSLASYKLSDAHHIQLGVFGNYHPIASVFLPAFGYTYRLNARKGFSVIFGFPRTYITYSMTKETQLIIGAIYEQTVAKLNRGYMEFKEYMANVGVRYYLQEDGHFELNALYAIKSNMRFYRVDVSNRSISSSIGIHFKWVYRFEG